MLKQEPEQRQNQIVARIFSVLGMKFPEDDEATDELLAEWRDALENLTIDEIAAKVEWWKAQGRTCPADTFALPVESTPEKIGNSQMTAAEIVDKAKRLYGESDMTFEQAYEALNLHQRWGPLPKERT